jgi:hypothetical protein
MIPTPEEQVKFLQDIQRLLGEGLFTASYKYALLLALADLAVKKGDGSGVPLDLDTREIAIKFIELYWQQSRPFQVGTVTTNLILKQNTDKQAAIITEITKTQQDWPPATVFRHFLFFFGRGVRAEQRLQCLACSFNAAPHLLQRRVFSFRTNAERGRVPISSFSPQTAVRSGFSESADYWLGGRSRQGGLACGRAAACYTPRTEAPRLVPVSLQAA